MAYSNTDFHMSTFFLFWGLLKLQRTKVFKAYLLFSLPVATATFCIFFLDVMGMQNDPGPEILGLAIFMFVAPIYFIYLYLIYFAIFFILVYIINQIKKWKPEYGLFLILFFNIFGGQSFIQKYRFQEE